MNSLFVESKWWTFWDVVLKPAVPKEAHFSAKLIFRLRQGRSFQTLGKKSLLIYIALCSYKHYALVGRNDLLFKRVNYRLLDAQCILRTLRVWSSQCNLGNVVFSLKIQHCDTFLVLTSDCQWEIRECLSRNCFMGQVTWTMIGICLHLSISRRASYGLHSIEVQVGPTWKVIVRGHSKKSYVRIILLCARRTIMICMLI